MVPLKWSLFLLLIGCTLYIHFRGKARLSLLRQLTDHSTFMAPINCLIYLFSGVKNRPYQTVEDLPQLQRIRDSWETIREEALALLGAGEVKASERYDDVAFNSFFRRGWKRFYLEWYGDPLPSAEEQCPKTVEILRGVEGINAAMFTFLPAGSKLMAHRDPYAGSLRYHLGLITPNDDACYISVDGDRYSWRDGQDVLFDETYLHYAANETDTDRLILFCDVARPMKPTWFSAFTRWFGRTFIAGAKTRNRDDEKIGFINVLFGGFYRVRLIAKALKRKSRPVYYTLKFTLIAGALFLLLR